MKSARVSGTRHVRTEREVSMTRFSTVAFVAAISVFAFTAPARSAVIVLNGGMGQFCYQMTKAVSEGQEVLSLQITGSLIGISPMNVCTMAITDNSLTGHELAGTYNNRGVLHFMDQEFNEAIADFEKARTLDPDIAE